MRIFFSNYCCHNMAIKKTIFGIVIKYNYEIDNQISQITFL